jgi:hypothetical protein
MVRLLLDHLPAGSRAAYHGDCAEGGTIDSAAPPAEAVVTVKAPAR